MAVRRREADRDGTGRHETGRHEAGRAGRPGGPVSHPAVAAFGLVMLVPLAVGLLRGSVGVFDAALRAVILLFALAAVDRIVVPLVAVLVGRPPSEGDDPVAPAT